MVKVTVKEGIIEALSPYSEEFVSFAHMRGGKWSKQKEVWMFDTRDEFAVRSALIDIYGTDDYETCEKVDIRFNFHALYYRTNHYRLFACGQEFARTKWDNIKLSDNTVVAEGELYANKNTVQGDKDTIIEMRAVPKLAAEKFYRENPDSVEIIGGLNIQRLKDERKDLEKRIAEIDETIATLENEEKEEGGIIPDLQD